MAILLLALIAALATPPAGRPFVAGPPEAQCYGRVGRGRLEGGVALPLRGPNFKAYSRMATALDRGYVHPTIRAILLESFRTLASTHPSLRFMFGETGRRAGGRFKPHRTHQNGTSVDLFVPMRGPAGESVHLRTWPTNKWGYAIEIDPTGRLGDLSLDFDALAALLTTIDAVARRHKAPLARVILAPEFRGRLFKKAPKLRRLPFMTGKAWVRHDEHIHVDFALRCKPL
ncbi:MAG: penicillin-insensitive murein endopeptidase [Bradymonadia bacterium]